MDADNSFQSSSSTPLPIHRSSPLNPSSHSNKGLTRSRPSIHPISPSGTSHGYGQAENAIMDYGSPMSYGMGNSYMGGASAGAYGDNGNVMRSWRQSFVGNGAGFGKYAESQSGMSFTMQSPMGAVEDTLFLGSYNAHSYSFTGKSGSYRSPAGLSGSMALPGGASGGGHSVKEVGAWGSTRSGVAKREADYCKNYVCCGIDLGNMHDLLEHYEESHVVVVPSPNATALELSIEGSAESVVEEVDPDVDMSTFDEDEDRSTSSGTAPSSANTSPVPEHAVPGLTRNRQSGTYTIGAAIKQLALDDLINQTKHTPSLTDDSASAFDKFIIASPPGGSAFRDGSGSSSSSSSSSSSGIRSGLSLSRKAFHGGLSEKSKLQSAIAIKSAFGSAARKQSPSEAAVDSAINFAVAPTVLFDSGLSSPAALEVTEAVASSSTLLPVSDPSSSKVGNEEAAGNGEPAPSLFATYRPYRCPQPGCQKSYKQANGLKYHMSKGQCNFEVRDSMEFGGLSQMEAEEKARPFLCAAGEGCQKRYRQMNGLKYHYMNSGPHGEVGLLLLAQNQHPQPPNVPLISKPRPSSNTIVSSRKMDRPFRPSGWVQDAVRDSGRQLGLPVGQERRGEDAVLFVVDSGDSF